ncbi:MAG: amidase family protein, partial [Pseudomonadota bacterium]
MNELIERDAVDVIGLLKSGEITPHDCLDALESRIAETEDDVHALPTQCFDRAREHADKLLERPLDSRGELAGLPLPIKDLTAVAGVRTTLGSRVFANHVPTASDFLVRNLEQAGAVVYAKSNTPEFGLGANSFNDLFDTTRTPYNTDCSSAGSSGGAAAALACGSTWLAHGSDMAGSLRTPASFCGVSSLRPSPGVFNNDSQNMPLMVLGQQGPMARNMTDLA